MSIRKVKDAKDLSTDELIYFKSHAKATYMSDGSTVEDAIKNIKLEENIDLSEYPKKSELSSVATTGSYNDLKNKPTIPSAVTETTVSNWGFTKTSGTYSKPSSGIPKSDLENSIQQSLNKADTALQSYTEKYTGTYSKPSGGIPKTDLVTDVQTTLTNADTAYSWGNHASAGYLKTETYKGTVTSIKINGSKKSPSSGVVDLGTVITSHQDISGKQDKLVSGTNIKTINGESVLGSGNITIPQIIYIPNETSIPETPIEGVLYLIGEE